MGLKGFAALSLVVTLAGSASYSSAKAEDDDGMRVVRHISFGWQFAYNSSELDKLSELYRADATFISGDLGALHGKKEITNAITKQMKNNSKITITPLEGHQNGNVAWGNGDYSFGGGPRGHYGMTAVNEGGKWSIVMLVSNEIPQK